MAGKEEKEVVTQPTQVDPNDLRRLEIFTERQDDEAKLHWQRNSYFIVVIGFLVVAYGLSPTQDAFQLAMYRLLICALGASLSFIWLLIQYRSSQYVLLYKDLARTYAAKTLTPDIYPKKLGGIEMRKLAYFLPVVFLVFWIVLGGFLVYDSWSSLMTGLHLASSG